MLVPFVVAVCLFGSAGIASAQADPYITPPPGSGPSVDVPIGGPSGDSSTSVVAPQSPAAQNQAAQNQAVRSQAVRSQSQGGRGLPVTGGDVIGLVVIGVGAVALGGLLLASRRRPALR